MLTVGFRRSAVLFAYFVFASIAASAAEIPVDAPAYGPAPRSQRRAAVASNGEQYLVLWNDERTEAQQTHAARVDGDGTVLDPNGIRVRSRSPQPGHVVWTGDMWVVVTEGDWDIEGTGLTEPELTRIDRNGKVLDPAPRTLPIRPESGVTLATDGRHIVVGYDHGGLHYNKRALVLDLEGEVVADFALSLEGARPLIGPPAIGSNGSVFVALWASGVGPTFGGRTMDGLRFDRNGPLDAPRFAFGSYSQNTPKIVSDGRDFMVIQERNIYRMTADLAVGYVYGSAYEYTHSATWTGSEYLVVLGPVDDRRDVKIMRFDRAGQLLGHQTMRLEGSTDEISSRAAASNGRTLLLAWHDLTEDPPATTEEFTDTYAATVSLPEMDLGSRKLLSRSAIRQLRAATASSASRQVTVWQEGTELYARRHRRDGSADGPPLRLSTEAVDAAIIFNGSDFIVASTEGNMVVTRRLPGNGPLRVAGESQIDGGSRPRYLAMATNGPVTLVAWLDNYGYNLQGGTVYAARAGADGSFLEQIPRPLAPGNFTNTVHKVAVSANDSGEFLVVWGGTNPFCNCSPVMLPISDVLRAVRVTSSLTVLDTPPIRIAIPSTMAFFIDHPSVTWNGNEWLVVWNRAFPDPDDEFSLLEEIRGRRIARNGTLLDGTPQDAGILIAQDAFGPTVAWTGSGYVVGWYQGIAGHRGGWDMGSLPLVRLRTATFDSIGGPLSNVRTIGESRWADPLSFSVADGFVTSAYARIADEPQYGGISRVFVELPSASRRRTVRR